MKQHERISARLAWHSQRMKELMDQGVSMVAASVKAFDEVTQMKMPDLEAWWDQHKLQPEQKGIG